MYYYGGEPGNIILPSINIKDGELLIESLTKGEKANVTMIVSNLLILKIFNFFIFIGQFHYMYFIIKII